MEACSMIINNRKDLDAQPDDIRQQFIDKLAGSINKWDWQGEWVLIQDTSSIDRFDFALSDFPDAPVPDKPDYNPDDKQAKQEALERITNLKGMLRDTDYIDLPSYDKEKPEIMAQRAEWRAEVRELEAKYDLEAQL